MNISKPFLIHSVTCSKVEGRTADRKPVYGEAVVLSNVWFSFTDAQNEGSDGKTSSDSATLYFDCKNSTPEGFVFAKDAKVTLEEKDYIVRSIHPAYGISGLEHYEVALV